MTNLLILVIVVMLAQWVFSSLRRQIADRDRAGLAARDWFQGNLTGWVDIPVERTVVRSQGNDVTLDMGPWGTLRMRCLWPRTVEVRALRRAFFRDDIGWIVEGTTIWGEPVRFYVAYAFHYPHHPAT